MVDVIVVGAGFSGITAARELSSKGYDVLILEANERIGGRTYRTNHKGKTFELGGAYVHWIQPHLWAELTRYGLNVVPGEGGEVSEIRLLSEGKFHTFDLETGYTLLTEAYHALYTADPQPSEVLPFPYNPLSHKKWIDYTNHSLGEQIANLTLSQLQYDLLNAMLASDMSASATDAALLEMLRLRALLGTDDFSKLADVTGTYMIEGGTIALLNDILADSGAQYRTGQQVAHITQDDSRVTVQTNEDEVYTARIVVVATPLNTWANIAFTPALSNIKTQVSKQHHAGTGMKCFIHVQGAIPELLGLAPEPHPISLLTSYSESNNGTWLVAFGPTAPNNFTVEWAQHAISQLLPQVEVTDVFGHNWTHDPLFLGTWANFKVGQLEHLSTLNAPEKRVFFAGADIALGWRGYIDGAIESGIRTANNASNFLRIESNHSQVG
ncbi:MAG: NAD(P)/FAD-dependent oxidoreductase [Chloroflexota bacterium]